MRRSNTSPLVALCLALAAASLSACATPRRGGGVIEQTDPAQTWQTIVTDSDAARLADIAGWWVPALAAAHPRFAGAVANEGPLLDRSVALDHVALPPGSYKCRVVKLGGARRAPAYRTFPPFFCYVRGGDGGLAFGKQTGEERPVGWLYADGDTRYVFLGAYGRGKTAPPAYGVAGARNALGVVERVAPFRWRLTLARTDDAALLTIYELTPVPVEQQAK